MAISTGPFASHQAAEKGIKGLFQKLHLDAWGQVLSVLLATLPESAGAAADLIDRAKAPDKHYIPTRYPNGFDSGAPTDYYTSSEAEAAIGDATAILELCRGTMG